MKRYDDDHELYDGEDYDAGYTSRYRDEIDDLTSEILNRKAFRYDHEKDPLYKQYEKTYTREGQRAMQDTLGQISARTGGLASSYAGSAAQQTYDNYMGQLADRIPELRQLAYDMYVNEGNAKRANLDMLLALEQNDYARYQDRMSRVGSSGSGGGSGNGSSGGGSGNGSSGGGYGGPLGGTDLYQSLYDSGMRSEGDAYAYLLSSGYNTTQAGKLAGYFSNWMEQQSGDEDSASVTNQHGDSWVYIPGHGRFGWGELQEYVMNGKVKEQYDPEKNSHTYRWNGN